MAEIHLEVVRVQGTCNAALAVGDTFTFKDLRIEPHQHDKVCSVAYATIVANVGRLHVEGSPLYIACPDPGTGEGGNVLFKLSLVEDHATDQG